jgi:predicted PurR-regulated permease PerM
VTEAAAWRLITRGTWYVLAAVVAVTLIFQLYSVAVQAIVAMIISAAVSPLADRLIDSKVVRGWRFKPSRPLIVLLVYLVLGVLGVVLAVVLLGTVSQQLNDLVNSLPTYATEVEQWLATVFPGRSDAGSTLQSIVTWVVGLIGQFLQGLSGAVGDILGETLSLVFTLILAVYFAADGERIQRYLLDFVPAARQPQADRVMVLAGLRLGAWVRGQLAVSAIVGLLFGVGLAVIGVPYALLLGIVAFIGEFVPLVGPFISSIPAVVVAFLTGGVPRGVVTIIYCLIVEQLEGDLIVPRVMGSATSIHPVAVMLAILAGAHLAGASGALLAVPVAGFVSVLIDELKRGPRPAEVETASTSG